MTENKEIYQLNHSEFGENELKLMRKIFEHAPVAVGISEGRNHRIKYMNKYLRSVFGDRTYSHGTPISDFWTELEDRHIGTINQVEIMDKVYATGEPFIAKEFKEYTDRNYDSTLNKGYFDFIYQPLKNANGKVYGIFITGYEVTEQVKTRTTKKQYKERLDITLEGARVGIWEVNLKRQKVDYMSAQCKAHFGKASDKTTTAEELVEAIHPEDRPHVVDGVKKAMEEGGSFEVSYRVRWPDGTQHWLLSRGQTLYDDQDHPERTIGITMDITAQKQAEEHLRQAVHVRDDFLSVAAHELQTPVTSIKARAELFERQLHDAGQSRWAGQAGKIHERIEQLSRLTGSLLDISRIREGNLDLHHSVFPLAELVAETVESLDHISAHHIELQGHSSVHVYADRYRIGQVLTNLLENAIKYSPADGHILVRISEPDDGRQVAVSVIDFGIGVSDADKQRIFERFYKGRGGGRDTYPGFGIGLFIAAQIVGSHGGSINVEDNDKQGSVFTFTLPAADP